MLLDAAHFKPLDVTHNLEAPPVLLNVQNGSPPSFSTLDVTTLRREWGAPVNPATYTLDNWGFSLLNKDQTTTLMCSVTGKPRPGNYMLRVRFLGSGTYYSAVIALSSYSLAGRLAYADTLAINVWHTIRLVHVSGNTYSLYVGSTLVYTGTKLIDIGLYIKGAINRFEIDTGQLGSALIAGYQWY